MSGPPSSPAAAAGERRRLTFSSIDEVIAEVRRLRGGGYRALGRWSLPQICWHLRTALANRMVPGPFPPETDEQRARRPVLEQVLATGVLPGGIEAPAVALPPPACGDEAIDAFVETLERAKTYPGPFAPHRLFGPLSDDEARRLNLIHCAHHLGHLLPTAGVA